MGVGKKMCKYKTFESGGLINRLSGKQVIVCSNTEVTKAEEEQIKKNQVYCSRRLCKHYESR